MIEIDILDESRQKFSLILSGQRVTMELMYSVLVDRWSFNLALDGEPVIHGRKMVCDVDLLAPFQLGIGGLFLHSDTGVEPNRQNLPLGLVKLYHVPQSELDAAVSS